MSEKFRQDHKIGFQNTFNTKCINVIIDSIGPSIILRSKLGLMCLAQGHNALTLVRLDPSPSGLESTLYH